MFTSNYRKWVNGMQNGNTKMTYKMVDGNPLSQMSGSTFYNLNYSNKTYESTSNYGASIHVGTGDTTPEAETNFALDSVCTEVSDDGVSMTINTETGAVTLNKTFTYNGAGTEIKEIGLFYNFYANKVLLAREILESPISVLSGDTFTVTMTIG